MKNLENLEAFLKSIVEAAQWRLSWEIKREEEIVKIDFTGEDAPILLAHNAEAMRALEYLLNRIHEKSGSKIVLDCNDYRGMREQELRLMAQMAAERVKSLRQPHKFSPMAPDERRIIHLAIAEDLDLRTESEGFGDNRKVVIYPK